MYTHYVPFELYLFSGEEMKDTDKIKEAMRKLSSLNLEPEEDISDQSDSDE
jgi:hypothetical protein